MKSNFEDVSLAFTEEGADIISLLEQIFRILVKTHEDGEENVQ